MQHPSPDVQALLQKSRSLPPRQRQELVAKAAADLRKREQRAYLEGNLAAFVKEAWPAIDSSDYSETWAIDALCDHLTAVTRGDIKRLLINFPPRAGKSSVASVCWPAWTWAQSEQTFVSGPNVRFLCGSYNHTVSLKLSTACRRLLGSPFYQNYWADRFDMMGDQNAKHQYDNTQGGSRIATSVGGSLIGIGGDVLLVDDPHNTEDVESEADRETVLRWWRELRSTRLNDPKQSAIVVVMQRLHVEDVSGVILDDTDDWTHLMLPMRHEPGRHCVTVLKWDEAGEPLETWEDPRDPNGHDLMWPERFGEKEVRLIEAELGPQMASGRLQQRPSPAGGGILKEEWWGTYELSVGAPYKHKFNIRVASLDPAFTAKQENDPSGFCVFGAYINAERNPRLLLMQAWEKWLELHGKDVPRENNEKYEAWAHRAKPEWGLVEWVAHECRRLGVHVLLIEDKASGHSVAQEMRRLYTDEPWSVVLYPVGTQDKRARAYSIQHLFSNGLVEAPASVVGDSLQFRDWAQFAINQCASFRGLPGDEDNVVDAVTQALRWLRDRNYAIRDDERRAREEEQARYKGSESPRAAAVKSILGG